MKIKNNAKLISQIESLIETNYLNMSLSDMFNEVAGNVDITSEKQISVIKKKFSLSDKAALISVYQNYWELDLDNEEDEEILNKYISPSIEECDINKYLSNPYYQKIKTAHIVEGDYELIIDHYQPYELFAYKDMSYEKDSFIELNSLSFFKEKFPFLALNHKGVTWMSVTPNEIETMEKAVNEATGKVVVYGLGIGYYPYMISLKEDVKEIAIIEKDEKIIELFKKHLLPLFEHKEKITIIKQDAFKYMQENHYFDYSFIDLWHNPVDGIELFLRAKKLENKGRYFYWLESSFYLLLRRCFISLLEEQLANVDESNYIKSKSPTDTIINTYYQKTKNLVITNENELQDLLSDNSLLNLLMK